MDASGRIKMYFVLVADYTHAPTRNTRGISTSRFAQAGDCRYGVSLPICRAVAGFAGHLVDDPDRVRVASAPSKIPTWVERISPRFQHCDRYLDVLDVMRVH